MSGNPMGRPRRGETFKDCLNRLSEVPHDDARTQKQIVCERIMALAMGGNLAAAQWIVERLEGKAAQHIELSKKEELLKGLSDAEVLDMIDHVKRKQLPASDNNADNV